MSRILESFSPGEVVTIKTRRRVREYQIFKRKGYPLGVALANSRRGRVKIVLMNRLDVLHSGRKPRRRIS